MRKEKELKLLIFDKSYSETVYLAKNKKENVFLAKSCFPQFWPVGSGFGCLNAKGGFHTFARQGQLFTTRIGNPSQHMKEHTSQ